jgi:hypothetical protein
MKFSFVLLGILLISTAFAKADVSSQNSLRSISFRNLEAEGAEGGAEEGAEGSTEGSTEVGPIENSPPAYVLSLKYAARSGIKL